MSLVNIPRDREDPNYRYKMPKLMSKIEGRGNGIRTNIFNIGEIARALKRPPMYPTKFFGCELGAMVKFIESEEKALINGAHNEQDLVKILDKFIQMYVLCNGCELPEMDIVVKKGILTCSCNACGYQGSLDNAHKAATYMVRNPPDCSTILLGKVTKKTKEERRAEKEKLKKSKEKKNKKKFQENGEGGSFDNSGDVTPTNEGEESDEERILDGDKDKKKDKERKKDKRNSDCKLKAEDRKVLQKEMLTFESPELMDVAERLSALMLKEKAVTPEMFFAELRMLQVSQDFDAQCRVYVILCTLFKDGLKPDALEERMEFISKCCDSSVRSEHILSAVEYFCGHSELTSLDSYPYVLQKFYNGEVLEAEEILAYYNSEKTELVFEKCKKYAEPFLQWLAEDDASSN